MKGLEDIKETLTKFRAEFLLFKGLMESEVGNAQTEGNLSRNLNRMYHRLEDVQASIHEIKIEVAVHDTKIGRSSAFYGAMSGMAVAILTAVVINFVTTAPEKHKILYKEKPRKEIKIDNESTAL